MSGCRDLVGSREGDGRGRRSGELAAAEQEWPEWQEWVIARRRVDAVPGDEATLEQQMQALVTRHLDAGAPDLFNRVVAALVRTVFEQHDSNQVQTAAALGISRNALRTQLAHLGIVNGRASRHRPAESG